MQLGHGLGHAHVPVKVNDHVQQKDELLELVLVELGAGTTPTPTPTAGEVGVKGKANKLAPVADAARGRANDASAARGRANDASISCCARPSE